MIHTWIAKKIAGAIIKRVMQKRSIRKMKEYSLYLNQLETLSIIIKEKLENVLILEDDAIPQPNFYLLDIKYPKDCDLLYLGGFFGEPSKKIIALNPN